jgi:hypothetical protein
MSRPGNNEFKEYSYDPYQAFLDDNEAYDSTAPNEELSPHLQRHIQTNQDLSYGFGGPRANYVSFDDPVTQVLEFSEFPTLERAFGGHNYSSPARAPKFTKVLGGEIERRGYSSPAPVPKLTECPRGELTTQVSGQAVKIHTTLSPQQNLDQDVGTHNVAKKINCIRVDTYRKPRPPSVEPMSPVREGSSFATTEDYQTYQKERRKEHRRNSYRKSRMLIWENENRRITEGNTGVIN